MHTIDDVYKIAGNELTERLLKLLKEDEVVNWFYNPIQVLDKKSPYELCSSGNTKMLENLVAEYESGVLSV